MQWPDILSRRALLAGRLAALALRYFHHGLPGREVDVIVRLARNTAITCVASAAVAFAWSRDVGMSGGIVAGGALVGLAIWALGGVVRALGPRAEDGEIRRVSRGFTLVKFFTRHVILALVAYVMMVRLHLDPVGMVVGVSSVVVAAFVEAMRPRSRFKPQR